MSGAEIAVYASQVIEAVLTALGGFLWGLLAYQAYLKHHLGRDEYRRVMDVCRVVQRNEEDAR